MNNRKAGAALIGVAGLAALAVAGWAGSTHYAAGRTEATLRDAVARTNAALSRDDVVIEKYDRGLTSTHAVLTSSSGEALTKLLEAAAHPEAIGKPVEEKPVHSSSSTRPPPDPSRRMRLDVTIAHGPLPVVAPAMAARAVVDAHLLPGSFGGRFDDVLRDGQGPVVRSVLKFDGTSVSDVSMNDVNHSLSEGGTLKVRPLRGHVVADSGGRLVTGTFDLGGLDAVVPPTDGEGRAVDLKVGRVKVDMQGIDVPADLPADAVTVGQMTVAIESVDVRSTGQGREGVDQGRDIHYAMSRKLADGRFRGVDTLQGRVRSGALDLESVRIDSIIDDFDARAVVGLMQALDEVGTSGAGSGGQGQRPMSEADVRKLARSAELALRGGGSVQSTVNLSWHGEPGRLEYHLDVPRGIVPMRAAADPPTVDAARFLSDAAALRGYLADLGTALAASASGDVKVTVPIGWIAPGSAMLGLGDVGAGQRDDIVNMLVQNKVAVRDGANLAATLEYRQSRATFNGTPAEEMIGLLGPLLNARTKPDSGFSATPRPPSPKN